MNDDDPDHTLDHVLSFSERGEGFRREGRFLMQSNEAVPSKVATDDVFQRSSDLPGMFLQRAQFPIQPYHPLQKRMLLKDLL